MNEFELIARLVPLLPSTDQVLTGPGDDCAVVASPGKSEVLLLKTDAVVEGVHFTKEAPPEQVGHKALARCLSDIAAMAGTPLHALITLALPPRFESDWVERAYRGVAQLAERYHTAIVGGETVRNPERIVISVAVLGQAAKGRAILRTGSKAGDAIFVTGELGGSIAGRHLEFEPRVREARWLADHFALHAMIDLSDGLAGDLRHLFEKNPLGADLLGSAIPISRAARLAAKAPGARKTALIAALTDGEDFELLFTLASADAVPLLDAWKRAFPETKLSCIGKVSPQRGLRLRTRTGTHSLPEHGYVHFE